MQVRLDPPNADAIKRESKAHKRIFGRKKPCVVIVNEWLAEKVEQLGKGETMKTLKLFRVEACDEKDGVLAYDPCRTLSNVVVAYEIHEAVDAYRKAYPNHVITGFSLATTQVLISEAAKQSQAP